jgi:hypothetical protein
MSISAFHAHVARSDLPIACAQASVGAAHVRMARAHLPISAFHLRVRTFHLRTTGVHLSEGRSDTRNPAFHLATAAIHVSVAVVDVSDALLHFAEPNPRLAPGFPEFRDNSAPLERRLDASVLMTLCIVRSKRMVSELLGYDQRISPRFSPVLPAHAAAADCPTPDADRNRPASPTTRERYRSDAP